MIYIDHWVVADIDFPVLKSLTLRGNLEFDPDKDPNTNEYRDFTLEVGFIIIEGGRLIIGWEDNRYMIPPLFLCEICIVIQSKIIHNEYLNRFMGNVEIILSGDQSSDFWPQQWNTPIGNKVIG